MYLIPNEEKKAKMFEQGLNSRIRIMMCCFNIQDFSQLMDQASIYEETLKKNAVEYRIRRGGLKDLVLRQEEPG
jgi:hypothetical protein